MLCVFVGRNIGLWVMGRVGLVFFGLFEDCILRAKPHHKPFKTSQISQNGLTTKPPLTQAYTSSHAKIATNITLAKPNAI